MRMYKCKHDDHGQRNVKCHAYCLRSNTYLTVNDEHGEALSQKKITRDHFEQIRYNHELLLTLMGWEIVE